MPKLRKLFLIFIITILLLQSGIVLAALELEQIYPEIGVEIQTITKNTTIPRLIKYYSTWAIIIAILVSVISLIAGGVIYLTSSGKPSATALARKRIVNSLIGLAILICSYLILEIINPQMTILQIKKVPVASGIIMLNKDGYDALIGKLSASPPIPAKPLKDIIDDGNAWPMGYWVLDAVDGELGELETMRPGDVSVNGPTRVNFKNFQFYAVGFWGKDAKNVKLITHSAKNLEGEKKEYTFKGQLYGEGHLQQGYVRSDRPAIGYGSDPEVFVIVFDQDGLITSNVDPTSPIDFGFFPSQVAFSDKHKNPPEVLEYELKKNPTPVYHPPLSWRREGINPGLYLYSKTAQRYLSPNSAVADFTSSLFDFAEPIENLEIRNVNLKTGATHDILAILREGTNYSGGIRLFFEKKSLLSIASVFLSDEFRFLGLVKMGTIRNTAYDFYKHQPGSCAFQCAGGVTTDQCKDCRELNGVFEFENIAINRGNVPTYNPNATTLADIEVPALDNYGKVREVLSAQTFELSNDKAVCKEVKICNQPDGKGFCISFNSDGRNLGDYQTFAFPMPWYLPVNIPQRIVGKVKMPNGKIESLKKRNWGGINPDTRFAGNIRSIKIEGKCLVVLFESDIKFEECLKCANTSDSGDCKKCWYKWEEPGSKSEVFVNYGAYAGGDSNLSDNLIGSCSGGAIGIDPQDIEPCARGIVVFPLK